MKLIRYEIKKTVLSRGFKGMCLVLLAVSVCFGIFFAEKPPYDVDAIERIMEEYEKSPASVKERYKELQKVYDEYTELLYSDMGSDIAVPELITEYEQYRIAFERINRQHTYIDKLDRTINELAKHQSGISNEQRMVNEMLKGVYGKNKTLRLGNDDMYGLGNLFELLSYLVLPIMIVGAFLGSTVVLSDRQRGSELLLHSTVYGRRSLFFAKTAACAVCCTVLSVSPVLVSVTVYSLSSDFCAFAEYIQNSDAFALYPMPLTVFEAILIILAFAVLSCFFVCTVACVVGKYSKNRVFSLVCSAVIIVFNFAVGFGDPNAAGSVLNIGSLTALCDGNTLFAHIYPVVIGGKAVYGMSVISILYFLCTIAICTVFVLHRIRPTEHKPFPIPELSLTRNPPPIKSLYAYECQKQLLANKTMLLLAVAVVIKLYVSLTVYNFAPTYTEQKYHSYMTSIEGEYTAEKQERLDCELSWLYEIMGQKEEMERKYRAGEITRNEMGMYLVEFYEAEQNEKALVKVRKRLEYIRSQIEIGKQPSVVYDTGWNKLLALETDIVLAVLIIAAMCGIYSDEYKNGMNKLYAVCNGKALHKSKIAFCIGFSIICVGVFSAVDTVIIACNHTLPLFTAQASSIEGTSFFNSLSLFGYSLTQLLMECVFVCGFGLAVAFLSYSTQNKVLTFLLSLSLMFVALLLL